MKKNFSNSIASLCRLFSAWLAVSLLGWCFEVVGRYFVYGVLSDRGFLRLPLCPIYGFCLIAVYFLLGTPRSPRALMCAVCRGRRLGVRLFVYFLFSALVCTLFELAVGLALLPFGVRLWIYEQKFNFLGIVCPQYSLLWGFLITAIMYPFGDRAYRLFLKIRARAAVIVTSVFGIPVLADFALRCAEVVLAK